MSTPTVHVIGAGLAGCEATYQITRQGVPVVLHEMKPQKKTPAHHTDLFAELCCSNSLRSEMPENAIGLLKAEMSVLGSLTMEAALASRVPAGSALAVDRAKFSTYITEKIRNNPLVTVVEGECPAPIEGEWNLVSTGPLTSPSMAEFLREFAGEEQLHFFDAAAPIVDASSIDTEKAFFASRYGKGEASYLNCPMTKEEYDTFYEALVSAETAVLKDFDRDSQKELTVFEGCMPVEVMARRGYDTLRYGPMKPVGLVDARTGKESYAVVQLRRENAEGTMFNLVGFQTHLTFPEQKRVFSMIPGLENATFLRYGVMHRNTYLNSPGFLDHNYRVISRKNLFFAGQMTGVEGYIESAGSGLVAGVAAARAARGMEEFSFPPVTMLGAMANYVSHGGVGAFSPMNANFGIVPPLAARVRGGKSVRNEAISARALGALAEVSEEAKR